MMSHSRTLTEYRYFVASPFSFQRLKTKAKGPPRAGAERMTNFDQPQIQVCKLTF
jgi:hypothetical protein